ncbi:MULTISPECIES: isoaspartyl peptidase/L-asparaginase family protein [Deinococcus]|uniref:Isoaspartyl peptidase/L-asparaginase family protein n=1 Tax=Deinococcus rufus TaxID=2136097 RepID=A0ABV7Z606_9DEIO|nr:isoaspartyl peptidase/L-asparaginase [Deinococcus sp. AB2017081]WQE95900.1 isoaspartyl peptidase/L-asparaginase [Deinococcus sp. AB2017081]
MTRPVLAIHGGCGAIPRADLTPETDRAARSALRRALEAGYAVLDSGGSAVDAVTTAVQVMEDDSVFNAGYGAALNRDGVHELDASLMDGASGRAGAVAGAQHIRNPVLAARALAAVSDPLLLIGPAADAWAAAHGLETVDNAQFTTPARQAALHTMLERERQGTQASATEQEKHGTVGAVALDRHGHLAAATSTGGYTAKPVGRVGDSPIVGAGTWADDRTCAVSGTGKGELFIRFAVGHDIHARMLYGGQSLETAASGLIHGDLAALGGAGLCAVDRAGTVTLPYNTEGMYRGWISADGQYVAIHED